MTFKPFNGSTWLVLRTAGLLVMMGALGWGIISHMDTKIDTRISALRKATFSRNEATLIIGMIEKLDVKVDKLIDRDHR